MSYKRTSFVRMPMDFLNARKLALGCIGLHTFIEAILGMNKKNIEKEAPKYTSRLIVRLTPQLHKEIAEYAALCGLTTSAYVRKRLEGKYPKQRLTDKEMEALNSLSDARGDIQKLFGFLKGRPLTERENILRSEIFMKRWKTRGHLKKRVYSLLQ